MEGVQAYWDQFDSPAPKPCYPDLAIHNLTLLDRQLQEYHRQISVLAWQDHQNIITEDVKLMQDTKSMKSPPPTLCNKSEKRQTNKGVLNANVPNDLQATSPALQIGAQVYRSHHQELGSQPQGLWMSLASIGTYAGSLVSQCCR